MRTGFVVTVCLAAGTSIVSPPLAAQAPSGPVISGPIRSTAMPGDPSHNYVFGSTPMDLKAAGYVEQEYFIAGTAARYVIPNGPGETTSPGTMPYKTRIVVRRPIAAAKFKGVVVLDWRNASTGHDGDLTWISSGGFFVREGWAWVGATVQRANVHGFPPPHPMASTALKPWNPERYGSLDLTNGGTVTDDTQALDVFTQIADAIRHPRNVDMFEGRRVQRIYASGGSQSAGFLIRYYNHLQSRTNAFDGFLATQGGPAPRPDQRAKILKVYTEADVARQAPLRVADSTTTHTWEIAGAPHMPILWQGAAAFAAEVRDLGADGALPAAECAKPFPSTVETSMVFTAGYAALDRWVTANERPAVTDRIQTTGDPSTAVHTILRDERGIARGGIRLPAVAQPTAVNAGENQPANPSPINGLCGFVGSHLPFDEATLTTMYPDRAAYLRDVRRTVEALVAQKVVMREDAELLIQRAEAALPRGR